MIKTIQKTPEELMIDLLKFKSDTNSVNEKEVEEYIYQWFASLDYFKFNPDHLGMYSLENDYFDRKVVWSWVAGSGSDTVVLLNHHDVVDSLDYGNLQNYAYSPKELKKQLSNLNLSNEVRDDLLDDDWIFGRGTSDMKAGVAIQMKTIEAYSCLKSFNGNILFVSVPDEENLSLGIRSAVKFLVDLKDKYSLNYRLVIDSEPHERNHSNEYVFNDKSIGKTMVNVFIKGVKSHIGCIFSGLNPSYILSKIVEKTEMNTCLSDKIDGVLLPPPSWSCVRDLKERYDGSIPEYAGGYISFLTQNRSPGEIVEDIKRICLEACDEVHLQIDKEYKKYLNNKNIDYEIKPSVITYEELIQKANKYNSELTENVLDNEVNNIKKLISLDEITLAEANFPIIKALLNIFPKKDPVVVISFSPPYYPQISNSYFSDLSDDIKAMGNKIQTYIENHLGMKSVKQQMNCISDLSYFAFQVDEKAIDSLEKNMPLWPDFYNIPFENMKELSLPILNIGPWGKGVHTIVERVCKRDLNENTGKIIRFVIDDLFNN